jgi:hypothetical protein
MRAAGITLSLVGPALTFLLGGLATAFAILGSPFTIASPRGFLVTGAAAAPGVALSLGAVLLALRSAGQSGRVTWLAALVGWTALAILAAAVVALRYNSNDLPWFFPLIALPLVSLIYWLANR